MAGQSWCDGTYRICRRQSPVAVFEYVINGTGTVIEDGRQYRPSAGDVYILHPQRCHEYYADAADPWVKIWFNIRGPLVEHLLHAYRLDGVNVLQAGPETAGLFHAFLDQASRTAPLPDRFDACALLLHQIISGLARRLDQAVPEASEAKQVKDYIQAHLTESLSLADLARVIYRSPSYTIRIFRAAYKQTPYACLAESRLAAAGQLLADTHLSIKAIADRFCYADQHYFATVFRRSTGLSPRQYRQLRCRCRETAHPI
jgi:AraC-like DNA-binding protein